MTCDDQGQLIPSNYCRSSANSNTRCPQPLCVPPGLEIFKKIFYRIKTYIYGYYNRLILSLQITETCRWEWLEGECTKPCDGGLRQDKLVLKSGDERCHALSRRNKTIFCNTIPCNTAFNSFTGKCKMLTCNDITHLKLP